MGESGPTDLHSCIGESTSYKVEECELGTARPLRVVCIGAGAAGLDVTYKLRKHLRNVDIQVYEKNAGIGGTWFENTYPGCACDLPAHVYQFSWAINPDWTEFYASGPEILRYLEKAAQDQGLMKYITLQKRVTSAVWCEYNGVWQLEIKDEVSGAVTTDWCHFLVNGTGFLNHWRWPDIEGLDTFGGEKLHTAAWNDDVEYSNKRVGVIGNGSSGIQIVTAVQPKVSELSVFMRSPTWISTTFAQEFAGADGANFSYSQEQKTKYRNEPNSLQAYRKAIESNMNSNFKLAHMDSAEQQAAKEHLTTIMKSRVNNRKDLVDRLIPEFGVGCRRPTPGVGYLEALTSANVRPVFDPIARVVERGIELKTGEVIELDVLICATGFDVSWRPRFPIVGRDGENLAECWRDRPRAYLSLGVPKFPNYFVYLGPNSPLAHGSTFPSIEHLTKYMIRLIHKIQIEGYKAVEPKKEAMDDFINHADEFLKRTVWASKCRSWLKGGKEQGAPLVHPGSRIHWFHMLFEPRWEDWNWTLSKNRFAYLGNGFSTFEGEGRDKAWYMGEREGEGYENVRY